MASQQDTLALAATVVDQFSRPLADLTRQLKAFRRISAASARLTTTGRAIASSLCKAARQPMT